jgi:Abnormal spindle-like microcephaly-assoc'd, ASPM-SPD-2-Hydin
MSYSSIAIDVQAIPGKEALGCPISPVQRGAASFRGTVGLFQNFGNGAIEYYDAQGDGTPDGNPLGNAVVIMRPMFTRWSRGICRGDESAAELAAGCPHSVFSAGALGYPAGNASNKQLSSKGTEFRFQNFEGGALELHVSGKYKGRVFEVHGGIAAKWSSLGFASHPLGLPTSDERDALPSPLGTIGRVNDFEGGHIHFHRIGPRAGQSFETHGPIDARFVAIGGTASCLGFPTSDVISVAGGQRSNFEGGFVLWSGDLNAAAVETCVTVVPSPAILIFPASFNFGTVNIGSSAQRVFTISNPGTATLTVTGVNISSAGDFDAVFPAPPFSIDPGLTSTFTVFFHPTALGLRQGTATLTSNASATPTSVPLSGAGSNPSPPPVTFMKTLGSPGDDFASSIQPTSDGGFIIAGYTNGLGAGREDVLLVKLDSAGAIQWSKTAGGTGSDIAYSVRQTSDGGYIVSGSTDGVTGVSQILVAKFDGTGASQWASTLGDPSDGAAGLSVQQTTDGGYIATGIPAGAIGGLGLLKYNASGQLQWLRRAPGPNHYGFSVRQTSDGGYIVAGNKQIGTTQYDLSLLKFDGSGNLQWAQLAGGSGNESGNAVQQTTDGGYIVAGATASFGAGGQDVLLLKYDGSGTLQWARTAGGSGDEAADSVQQTSDGGYIVSGHTSSFGASGTVVVLLKFDSAGAFQWARAGGGSTSGTSVQQTTDGAYILAGSTASFGAGGSDVLLIRTDASGNVAGCAGWSSVSPSIGTIFPSAATSYSVDSPSFSIGAPTFTTIAAPLTSNNICP